MKRNLRIKTPRKTDGVIELAEAIKAKHTADGAGSPLDDDAVTAMSALLTTAETKSTLAKQLHKDAETATHERSLAVGNAKGQNVTTPETLLFYIRMFRNTLVGENFGDENRLGDWGYEVDTSPRVKKVKVNPS